METNSPRSHFFHTLDCNCTCRTILTVCSRRSTLVTKSLRDIERMGVSRLKREEENKRAQAVRNKRKVRLTRLEEERERDREYRL